MLVPISKTVPVVASDIVVPVLVAASGHNAIDSFLNFFATQIENDNTRAPLICALRGIFLRGVTDVQPIHVAAWIKHLKSTHAVPTVKLRLAAIRHLFDWMVTGHVMQRNPALSVRGPKHVVRKDKTPVIKQIGIQRYVMLNAAAAPEQDQ